MPSSLSTQDPKIIYVIVKGTKRGPRRGPLARIRDKVRPRPFRAGAVGGQRV